MAGLLTQIGHCQCEKILVNKYILFYKKVPSKWLNCAPFMKN